MATRGTYSFGSITFYCHWDNYPEGAAVRFWNALNRRSRLGDDEGFDFPNRERDGLMGAFYRENTDAEFTGSHEDHGDTEYRYSYDPKERTLKAEARDWETSTWRTIFAGNVVDFIDRYYESKMWGEGEWSPVGRHVVKYRHGHVDVLEGTLANAEAVAAAVEKKALSFQPDNPNREGYLERSRAWLAVAADAASREMNRKPKAA